MEASIKRCSTIAASSSLRWSQPGGWILKISSRAEDRQPWSSSPLCGPVHRTRRSGPSPASTEAESGRVRPISSRGRGQSASSSSRTGAIASRAASVGGQSRARRA